MWMLITGGTFMRKSTRRRGPTPRSGSGRWSGSWCGTGRSRSLRRWSRQRSGWVPRVRAEGCKELHEVGEVIDVVAGVVEPRSRIARERMAVGGGAFVHISHPFFVYRLRRNTYRFIINRPLLYIAGEKINEGNNRDRRRTRVRRSRRLRECSRLLLRREAFYARAGSDSSGHNVSPTGSQMSLSMR